MIPVIIFALLKVIALAECKKVLGIYGHPDKTHQVLGEVILEKLAERGHEVTMVSAFPLKNPITNYKDVYLDGFLEEIDSDEGILVYLKTSENNVLNFIGSFQLIKHFTDRTFGHPAMQKLINSGEKFDLIIMDWFCKDAELFYGNIFEAPIIVTSSLGIQNELNYLVNNPELYSYVPTSGFSYTDDMTFFERVGNTLGMFYVEGIFYYNKIQQQHILDAYFRDAPRIDELYRNVDLVFSNSHPVFESPRPYLPNIVPIGGIHVQEPRRLPKDLQDFLDKSLHGVVYFSLGSYMTSSLPKHIFDAILFAFSRLSQNVLMKWEKDEVPVLPHNVMVKKWMPQTSVLAHRNVKVFVTQGSLMSKIEAIFHGIPMVGIPLFGDQKSNVAHSVHEGIALQLTRGEVTEASLFNALNEIISNSSYRENIKKKSVLLRSQPMKPIETAIFWSEFVMTHNGTKYLQNKGMRLNRLQNLSVDVILFILLVMVLSTTLIFTGLFRFIYKKIGFFFTFLVKLIFLCVSKLIMFIIKDLAILLMKLAALYILIILFMYFFYENTALRELIEPYFN